MDVPGKEKSEAVDKEEEKKAKQRERQRKYREQKKAQAATTGTKKKSAAKKADASQLNFLLLTISNVMASRPGMEMWKLTNEEVDSIAEPLANMMARNEAVANALEEHGDAIALVTAIAMIAFPRVMMMMAAKKEQAPKHPAVQEVKSNANRSESATGSRDKKERLVEVANLLLSHLPIHVKFMAEHFLQSFLQLDQDIDDDTFKEALEKLRGVIDYVEHGHHS